jgi:hypothetical protein
MKIIGLEEHIVLPELPQVRKRLTAHLSNAKSSSAK